MIVDYDVLVILCHSGRKVRERWKRGRRTVALGIDRLIHIYSVPVVLGTPSLLYQGKRNFLFPIFSYLSKLFGLKYLYSLELA